MMSDRVREVEIELFARQNEAIRLLAEANYGLVSLLKQHLPEGELAPLVKKAERAVEIYAESAGEMERGL